MKLEYTCSQCGVTHSLPPDIPTFCEFGQNRNRGILIKYFYMLSEFERAPADLCHKCRAQWTYEAGVSYLEEIRQAALKDNPDIKVLRLSVRVENCLRRADIYFVAQLKEKSDEDILLFRNMGSVGLREIKEALENYG